MSFTIVEPRTPRLSRSVLAVPGGRPALFEKAAKSAADIVFLDLEDAVAAEAKEEARRNIIAALNEIDWGGKTMSVRINGADTHWMYRDVIDVVEQAGDRLDLLMIPKVGTPGDVYALDMLVTQIEAAKGLKKRLGFELIIETALGLQNIAAIATASPRIESLHFGAGDYAASTGARSIEIGGSNPDYAILTDPDAEGARRTHWGDMWHYALSRIVMAARANGLRPVDGPFGDFSDPVGFTAAAKRVAAMGFDGKLTIHPSQIPLANEIFTPPPAQVERARRILAVVAEANRQGRGAVALDGKLVDVVSIRQAQVLVKKAEAIAQAGR
jgi:malyl-CoA/(S)-citramalyl-CoA lyase